MKDEAIYEKRRRAVMELIERKFAGVKSAFGKAIDADPTYVSRMLMPPGRKGRKRIATDRARAIEKACGEPEGSLDGKSRGGEQGLYIGPLSTQAARIGREWSKLHEPLRSQIAALIDTLVQQQLPQNPDIHGERSRTPRRA